MLEIDIYFLLVCYSLKHTTTININYIIYIFYYHLNLHKYCNLKLNYQLHIGLRG